MFDIGFLELGMIGVVALLVIGPERLPKVAKTAGMWAGRARRFVSSVKRDIDKELEAEELKKTFDDAKAKNPMHEIIEETRQGFASIKQQTEEVASSVDGSKPADKPEPGEGSKP